MNLNKKINIGMFFLFVIFFSGFVSASMRSQVEWSIPPSKSSTTMDQSVCQQGQDFIIQIAPFGCTPAVVRSDLLEENDVPVYCKLGATKINPLVDVEMIDSVSFSGKYPKEISGIGFHPAKAALGIKEQLNSPVLENIGYVVLNLKKQSNVSAIPESISGTLTAKIKYNLKNAFGIGRILFYLPELSNDDDWEQKKDSYNFWGGKGSLRAENIDNEGADISVYSNNQKISSINLKKGESSNSIYLPGFNCEAGLKLKLEGLENANTRAHLRINAESIEVAKGEKFLDNKCELKDLKKNGIIQKITVRCKEDEGTKEFSLIINPKIILKINGIDKEVELGQKLYDTSIGTGVYLGYIGTKGNSKESKDLFIYLVAMPSTGQKRDMLTDEELSSINSLVNLLIESGEIKSNIIDKVEDKLKLFAGLFNRLARAIGRGENFYRINFENQELDAWGAKISIINFADAQDIEITNYKEQYESAKKDYETIRKEFSSEIYSKDTSSTFGEEALYNEIILAWDANQKKTVSELCIQFNQDYPNSRKDINSYYNTYKISNKDSENNYVSINKKIKQISFDGIYEPSFEDYGAKIILSTPSGAKNFDLRKNSLEYISDSGGEYIQLLELDENLARIKMAINQQGKLYTSDMIILTKDIPFSIGEYSIILQKINLKKLAKVSVVSNIDNTETKANFTFKIGIEKRAIELPPKKVKKMVQELNNEITQWKEISNSLGETVEGLKTGCLIAGSALVLKNFASSLNGAGIARQEVMRGDGGWAEKCAELVGQKVYSSQEKCFLENADKIDKDVKQLSEVIKQQNSQIKQLEQGITKRQLLSEKIVDTDKFMERYVPQVSNLLNDMPQKQFEDPKGLGEPIDKDKIVKILSEKDRSKYSLEQLRNIELYAKVLSDKSTSPELKEIANAEIYSNLLDIQTNSKELEIIQSNQNKFIQKGFKNLKINILEREGIVEVYGGGTVGTAISELSSDTPVQGIIINNEVYLATLDPIDNDKYTIDKIYDENYKLVIDENKINLIKAKYAYFKKSSGYTNSYKNAKIQYYETEPYKGLPSIVPFDLQNGWYAAIKSTLPVGGSIQPYDSSAKVSSFYLCNVGGNGMEEFQTVGDDSCQMINLGTGQPYNQFPGIDNEAEAKKLVEKAKQAIEQASKMYRSGLSGKVKILNEMVEVGTPAVNVPQFQCQDFMSPKECLLIFNLCDPVICPPSRCNLGGAYPVRDVVQSGIIGSMVLCLPNIKEKIMIPVCLTGIKAGIDGFLSVKTSYRDCLNESLTTGKMVGVCDEIYSIYLCDFFWKQALPLADMIIPKVVEALLGQNVRGGGEYLGVSNAWDNAKKSVDYFTNSYGVNSKAAFFARSTEQVGEEVCKSYVSSVYPSGGDLLNTLTKPDSPAQFHGRFDDIPFTTATVPATSHYKVFYHIYAGKDSGAYYKVYLRGIPGSSYYKDVSQTLMVASGYIAIGGYASETKDFTGVSGYKELCINVNGQEECGFKEVSTSFAVNYIKDEYLKSQATKTDITKESTCISGSTSAYSILNPNLQSAAEEMIDPAIYNRGVIRICATDNPGKGTDAYAGTENSRWKEVGYCDNKKIKCWLDTQSVEDVIKTTTVEKETLEEVSEDYKKILEKEEGYLNKEQFLSTILEIEKEKDSSNKLTLIEKIFEKVFWSDEKVQLIYLRGNIYADLFRNKLNIERKTEPASETPLSTEETGLEEVVVSNEILKLTNARERVLKAIDNLEGKSAEKSLINLCIKKDSPEDINCWDSIMYVYKQAGVVHNCIYSDEKGKKYEHIFYASKSQIKEEVEVTIGIDKNSKGEIIFQVNSGACRINQQSSPNDVNQQQKYDNISPGDILSIVSDSFFGHNVIFVKWVDKSKKLAQIFGWRRVGNNIVFKKYEEDISETGNHPVYMYWEPIISGSSENEQDIFVTPSETEKESIPLTIGNKIDQESIKLLGKNLDTAKFISTTLTNAGVKGITISSSLNSLISNLENKNNFAEINIKEIKKGDIILLGKKCNLFYSAGILSSLENNQILFYTNLAGDIVEKKDEKFVSEINNNLYFYRAYRYIGDLTKEEKDKVKSRTRWTLQTALEQTKNLKGKYSDNKIFVDQLIFDGILTEKECTDVRGGFLGFGQKDMTWIWNILDNRNPVAK